jgi:ribosomal silencing factor RsfS
MHSESPYLKEIKEFILKNNTLGITELRKIEFLKGLNFSKDVYESVLELIKQKKIKEIIALPNEKQKTFEDLTIIRFYDQNNRKNIAAIYDTDELWQDPEILEIFPQ